MDKAPAQIRMGWGFLQVCSSMAMAVTHARPGAHSSAALCRFDLLTPVSEQITEEGLHLFGFVVGYTYFTMCTPLWGSFRIKSSLSPGGAHFLGSPIARGGKDSLGHSLSSWQEEASRARTKSSVCGCLSVLWKACKSFPSMKTLCHQETFNFSHLSIKFSFLLYHQDFITIMVIYTQGQHMQTYIGTIAVGVSPEFRGLFLLQEKTFNFFPFCFLNYWSKI